MGDSNTIDSDMATASQVEEAADAATPSSIDSSPDQDQDAGAEQPQEPAQPQKRKGGRKPVSTICNNDSYLRSASFDIYKADSL